MKGNEVIAGQTVIIRADCFNKFVTINERPAESAKRFTVP